MWTGTRPRMFGSAKLVWPLPPNVVPRRAKSAWFWLMGRSCPLESAHPFGGKLKLMIRISARNGSAIVFSLANGSRQRAGGSGPRERRHRHADVRPRLHRRDARKRVVVADELLDA